MLIQDSFKDKNPALDYASSKVLEMLRRDRIHSKSSLSEGAGVVYF